MPGPPTAAPSGRLLLAVHDGQTLRCIGVRPVKSEWDACEMKRLYVREVARALDAHLGCVDRMACYDNPTAGVSYLERVL